MKIGITGVRGFIGSALVAEAGRQGHDIIGYSRAGAGVSQHGVAEMRQFTSSGDIDLSGVDALVHLAGEPVFGVWTAGKRARIRESRVAPTSGIARVIREMDSPPKVFVCGTATGFYGHRGDEELPETALSGEGFLASVVRDWEAAAEGVEEATRLVRLRTGMVLGRGGGASLLLEKVFKLGLGGKLGNGAQWMPWVHLADVVGMILWSVSEPSVDGAVNVVAPGPATNRDFTRALAATLHRPAVLPAPAFLMKLVLGGFAEEALLVSQKVVPSVAEEADYPFLYRELGGALRQVFGRGAGG